MTEAKNVPSVQVRPNDPVAEAPRIENEEHCLSIKSEDEDHERFSIQDERLNIAIDDCKSTDHNGDLVD